LLYSAARIPYNMKKTYLSFFVVLCHKFPIGIRDQQPFIL